MKNSQIENFKVKIQPKTNSSLDYIARPHHSNEKVIVLSQPNSHKKDRWIPSTQSTFQNIQQDIIKELTLKNQILCKQISEYKVLVRALEEKIRELNSENYMLHGNLQNEEKGRLRTIQQELISLSDISMHNDEKQATEAERMLKQLNSLLFSQEKQKCRSWNECYKKIEIVICQHRQMEQFIEQLWRMKDKIDSNSDNNLIQLWQWLRMLGLNYYYLSKYYLKAEQTSKPL